MCAPRVAHRGQIWDEDPYPGPLSRKDGKTMALFFYGMAILAIIGGFGIVFWARKTEEGYRGSMGCLAAALFVTGILMLLWAWYWG